LRLRRNSARMAVVSALAALTSSQQPTNLIPLSRREFLLHLGL
jgi:hypothetical protein